MTVTYPPIFEESHSRLPAYAPNLTSGGYTGQVARRSGIATDIGNGAVFNDDNECRSAHPFNGFAAFMD
jgi:hypothetical protein